MGLKLVVPPDGSPVTVEEVKAQLEVQDDDDDVMLAALIEAATASLDGPLGDLCGRALKPQTWDLYLDAFPGDVNFPSANGYWGGTNALGGIRLPLPPLIEVESVNYVDPETEMEVVLATSEYTVDIAGTPHGWVIPQAAGWPAPMSTVNAVRVRFVAGYPDTEDSPAETTVPAAIRQAIIMLVIDMYGRGSAFVDKTQTPNRTVVESLIQHHVIRAI